jgi:hypothetical protein
MPRAADPDNIKSALPYFEVKPSEDFPGWLLVFCPYKCTEKPFIVHKESWLAKREVATPPSSQAKGITSVVVLGRCCPYCHKTGLPRTAGRRKSA